MHPEHSRRRMFEKLERRDLLAVDVSTLSGLTFQNPIESDGIGSASAALLLDVTGDGRNDVVFANEGIARISMAASAGGGRYESARTLVTLPESVNQLVSKDVNGDGRHDLIAANSKSVFAMIAGDAADGGTAFSFRQSINYDAASIEVADLDGDGHMELILYGESVDVYFGNGDGTFGDSIKYLSDSDVEQQVRFADTDNDGDLDMVSVRNINGQIGPDRIRATMTVLRNDDGIFENVLNTMGLLSRFDTLRLGDFDGDDIIDMLYFGSGHMFLHAGFGNGTFADATEPRQLLDIRKVELADVNGDGLEDVLVSHSSALHHPVYGEAHSGMMVLLATPSGQFLRPVRIDAQDPIFFTTEDVNGDGLPDLVVVEHDRILVSPQSNLEPGFRPTLAYTADLFDSFVIGDLNSDSLADYAVGSYGSDFVVGTEILLGRRDGTFDSIPTNVSGRPLHVANFDSDIRHELAIFEQSFGPSRQAVHVIDVNASGQDRTVTTNLAAGESVTGFFDVNADGIVDLLVNDGTDTWTWQATPGGEFQKASRFVSQPSTDIEVHDLNGDGASDVVVISRSQIAVLINDKNGEFRTTMTLERPVPDVEFHDFDGDGKVDLGIKTQSRVELRFGNGDGTFDERWGTVANAGVVFADKNGDGKTDVFVDELGHLGIYLSQGRSFEKTTVEIPYMVSDVFFHDVDGDGLDETILMQGIGYSFRGPIIPSVRMAVLDAMPGEPEVIASTTTFATTVFETKRQDVDFDGTDELVGRSFEGFFIYELDEPKDVNFDGVVSHEDVDALCAAIANPPQNHDLNTDGVTDVSDVEFLVETSLRTVIGDVNFDGVFNSTDLIEMFRANEYEDGIARNSMWTEGDWTCDGEFDSSDLVYAFKKNTYSVAAAPKRLVNVEISAFAAAIDHSTDDRRKTYVP